MSPRDMNHAGLNVGATDHATHAEAEYSLFGFWIFLMSDALVFALLFAIYATLQHATAGGPVARDVFEIGSVTLQTLVLLASSFTYGLASLAMKYHEGRLRPLVTWLLVTLALGLVFLGLEVHDFLGMADKGALPQRSAFLSAFFALVGMHGVHVASGCLWLVVMLVQLRVFGLDTPVKTRLMRLGLFWHFLDIVWVAILSVVYLQGLLP
ncbi:cytochrome (ubi)quinol oxidase subunit III [Pseudomonas sp. HR1]|jgi:cytochrome o ubiquinol oxidase subunit 3|uniref:Cytochrome bo(3) ubiquinol oxidase subunit 3 n=1 Tax=Pseudomonas oryzihabitans TaxID=47885 RepID=A0A1G5M6D5_9PSED|nr:MULTISPECIES: cytochrome (ubi)quinol oxidase subunit III [Pseudomonas]KIZ50275.1 cytochrome o ubiquinol oxidase subunit III [Pseudomonas oryzihabitans]KTT03194.1 cytochrome o ubiquinol oxidase subunit III [Pseudomonas psychrotolerans]KTT51030.1 cytochrome o ubiquinol oxidase subunit III [Pseudomonas psychrotolerans]KTT54488.1 cytochrome o ubiquinol oxidase subunit III [Pseudomonas psychrotolerans]KTT55271.1 cytochrome o ubiquinol oxidase subunit III [Pseudomonas psychrotolerans]